MKPNSAEVPTSTPAAGTPADRKRKDLVRRRLYGAGSLLAVILGWHAVTARGFVNPTLLPSPEQVLDAFADMVSSGELLRHIAISLQRILIGFSCGLVTAVPFGLLLARVRLFRAFFEPIVEIIRPVPSLRSEYYPALFFVKL